jgi:glycosyltransferase involved in cell wall biosynthesis
MTGTVPMRIAMLMSRVEGTGVTTHTLDLTRGLLAAGHQVCLITGGKVANGSARVDEYYNTFIELGAIVKEFPTPSAPQPRKSWQTLRSILQIIGDLRAFRPNVIHCQSPYMTFIPWLMRKKFATTLHIPALKRNLKFKTPTRMIAISKETYEFSKTVFGMADRQISLVHHGVSDHFARPVPLAQLLTLRRRLAIAEDKLVIGCVSNISHRKGHDIMVAALQNLSDAARKQIHCVFLGGTVGSESFQWLEEMVRAASIESFVSLIPFDDPKPFYDLFAVFVLPSRKEAFPLVTLEAMMSGCCPVRSRVEGASEQIEDGVSGLLFASENVGQLSAILEKLITDPGLRDTLARNARAKAQAEFTIPVMTEKILQVYEAIRMP